MVSLSEEFIAWSVRATMALPPHLFFPIHSLSSKFGTVSRFVMYKKAFSLLLSLTALSVAHAAPDRLDNAKANLEVSHDRAEHAKTILKEGKEKAFLRVDQKRAAFKEAREERKNAPVDEKADLEDPVDEKQVFPLKDSAEADLEEPVEKKQVFPLKDRAEADLEEPVENKPMFPLKDRTESDLEEPVEEKQKIPLRDQAKSDLEEFMGKLRVHQAKNALKETMETTAARVEDAMAYLKEVASGRVDEAKTLLDEIMQEHQAAVDAQQIFAVTDKAGTPCLCTCRGGLLIDVLPYEALTPTKTLCFSAVVAQFALVDRPEVFRCTPSPECPVKNEWIIKEDEPYEPATADEETLAEAAEPQQRK
jgi:hypothetical protein